MAETKHTPGPWGLRGGKGMDLIAGPDGKALMSNDRPSVELIANAMVICAAPELLEALRPLAAWAALRPDGAEDAEVILHAAGCWPVTWGDASRAAAAIAKAEGRHVA